LAKFKNGKKEKKRKKKKGRQKKALFGWLV
jgi:hypothetical protein